MNSRSLVSRWRNAYATVIGFGVVLLAGLPVYAQVDIADAPLFLTSSVEPNVLFLLDDSGSMQWETMDDDNTKYFGGAQAEYVMWTFPRVSGLHGGSQYSNQRTARFDAGYYSAALFRAAELNTVYYNPAVTYRPWSNEDGTLMADADPTAAPHRPLFPGLGTRNLTADNTQTAHWVNDNGTHTNQSRTFFPALYYQYDGVGDITDYASYERVEIRLANGPFAGHGRERRTDAGCSAGTCSYNAEIQNFANWYSYHRNRVFAARAGIGRAFSLLPEHLRVGYGTINANPVAVTPVRSFAGTDREAFFDQLYTRNVPAQGTPMRIALQRAGEYFQRTDNAGPWGHVPGTSDPTPHLPCRQSYTILMTDGYYNNDTPGAFIGNADGTAGPVIPNPSGPSYQYVPSDPYEDGRDRTLADVAMYYWQRDLRPDLPNRVPTSARNEAFWQHMVTYGIGLAVQGDIDPDDAWAAVADGTPIAWGNPLPNAATAEKIDDLLHAAINSRGGFFSASDAETFSNELIDVLNDIVARVESSSTSAATSSAVLQSDTLLYTAGFRSTDWSGTLTARAIDPDDGSVGSLVWDAEQVLAGTSPALRNILAVNSQSGLTVELDFSNLGPAQQAALNYGPDNTLDSLGADRVDWLRGFDPANAAFRSRQTPEGLRLLGDIVHSNPQFVSNVDYGYSLLGSSESATYATFRASIATRADVIYVGANDGMLHAFDAENGEELFAFMPSELLLPEPGRNHAPVTRLMSPDYDHRYLVDGTPAVSDAYVNGSWKTVLVGTMGAGGRTVFALDVTDPNDPEVLWEFQHADLGYNVDQPTIARMRNGQWAAIFGNGYNSNSHQAALFVVNLNDGSVIARVATGIGSIGNPNGLASPIVTDWPSSDLEARRIYAGDLHGNMWRFDVSSFDPTAWENAANRDVLFAARDSNGVSQPITAKPAVAAPSDLPNTLVVAFGTGSYFRHGDGSIVSPQVQTLYGVFDTFPGTTVASRANLLEQTITWQGTETFDTPDGSQITYDLRTVSENLLDPTIHRGWYVDLIYGGNAEGERVISPPTFPSGMVQNRARFTTLIPDSGDPCGSARRGFLMDIDLRSGSRYASTVFDLNIDGEFDADDWTHDTPPSGVGFGSGEIPTVIRQPGTGREILYSGDGEETIVGATETAGGRQSWRQLR